MSRVGTTLTDVQKHPIDRTRNVVITGIAEDRTDSVWRSKVADVLCAAAGHTIQTVSYTHLTLPTILRV